MRGTVFPPINHISLLPWKLLGGEDLGPGAAMRLQAPEYWLARWGEVGLGGEESPYSES
jgi:hypothetical protein